MIKCPDLVDDIFNLESKVMRQQFTKKTTIMEYFNKALRTLTLKNFIMFY